MKHIFRRVTSAVVAAVISATLPVPLAFADSNTQPLSAEQEAMRKDDFMLNYWGALDQERPDLTEFALGEPLTEQPLWTVADGNPLLDSDPFFMRSQQWSNFDPSCAEAVCFRKSPGHLLLSFAEQTLAIDLHEDWTPLLETEDYILMAADSTALFASKTPADQVEPGEGFFFINKNDVISAHDFTAPVPVFFFPLPGPGWGPSDHAFEFSLTDQVVLYNAENFGLPIDVADIALIEKVERNNLLLAQTWSFLEGQVSESGVALPKPSATLGFGLFLSGQLPKVKRDLGQNARPGFFSRLASKVVGGVLPTAHADEQRPTLLRELREMYKNRWRAIAASAPVNVEPEQLDLPLGLPPVVQQQAAKPAAPPLRWWQRIFGSGGGDANAPPPTPEQARQLTLTLPKVKNPVEWKSWITPGIMYGGTAVAAWAVAPHVDWASLITADMPERIAKVAMLMGGVLAASVTMKYTLHKALLDKKYPKTPYETKLQRLNKEHKGILDELVHGLWFSLTITPQGMRQILDFYKDRFFPGNSLVQRSWESTVGFMIRQSSRLAMNWKTFYLGSGIFGMADATMVAVDLLIFMPWLIHTFNWNLPMGGVTAAYVSAMVLGNFLGYLQHGAHDYSASTKMIYMRSAESKARRELELQGLDPDATKNQGTLHVAAQAEMEKRFRAVGLPGDDEFLYDPITFIEGVIGKSGFSTDALAPDQQRALAGKNLILRRRHFGLLKPSIRQALATAQKTFNEAPTEVGAQVIKQLNWVMGNRSAVKAVGERVWDVAGSQWATDGLKQSMLDSATGYVNSSAQPSPIGLAAATLGGAFNYLALDSTETVRDIRLVMLLMSNGGSADEVLPYLPQSWIEQAGSLQAAQLSARLIHDAFHAYLARDPALIAPDAAAEARFGARADAELAQAQQDNPTAEAQDDYARLVRRRELIGELKHRDQAQAALLNYNPFYYISNIPPEEGVIVRAIDGLHETISKANYNLFAKRQWEDVRAMTDAFLRAEPDSLPVTPDWEKIAARFNADNGQELSANVFTSRYRYRMIVARNIARKVGLWVQAPEQSEFVQKVLVRAVAQTELQMALPAEQHYSRKLDSDLDREFYAAQIFSRNFISNYINMAVATDEHISGSSPEYPGIGQRIRRAVVGVPGGRAMSGVVRSFEGLWRNEDNSYVPGLGGFLNRNIPLLPDSVRNFLLNMRVAPYVLSLSYLTGWYLWQIHTPYVMYVVGFLLGFSNSVFVEINNRLQRFFDKKPMGSVPNNLTYSFVHSRLTNPQAMFEEAFAQTIADAVSGEMATIGRAAADCEKLLLGR